MLNYGKFTLDNDLTLLTIPMPAVKTVTVMLLVGAGSRYETKNINGLSHFLEHMAFKGSKKRPTALAISSAIDSIGGEFNAFTGKDHTGFYIKAAANHTELLIDVLSDMLLNPILDPSEIEREKGVIIEEINMYEDTPMRHISDIYEELMYGDTPLGRDTTGTREVIKSLNRKHFTDYIDSLYRPNNAVLIISGGIRNQESGIREIVEKSLGIWSKKSVINFTRQDDSQNKPQVRVKFKDTEQAHLALGVRAYSLKHPKRFALNILSSILGGGMSSRLFIEVRERRGLAYYVRSDMSQYIDVGNFVTQAGVDMKRIGEAIQVIMDQCLGMAKGKYPITKEELNKGKEYLKGRLTLELEDSRSVAGFYGSQEILKRDIKTPEEAIAKNDAVTIDEVLEVAREIFQPEKLNLAIIGPFRGKDRFERLLEG